MQINKPDTLELVLLSATRALGQTMEYHEARLQAELLLSHSVGTTRALLLARLDEPVEPDVAARFAAYVARRAQHEPLAYVLGHQGFFGLDLIVDRRVLIPRHESELLVTLALERITHVPHITPVVVDVGTGSGALALSLAQHLPQAMIVATDISPDALAVAAVNASRLGMETRIELRQGDLLEPLTEKFDLLVANLPYIPSPRFARLPHEIQAFEPRLALDGGEDGFAVMRRLLAQLASHAGRGAVAFFEISEEQGTAAVDLCRSEVPDARVSLHADIEGLDRVVELRLWDE